MTLVEIRNELNKRDQIIIEQRKELNKKQQEIKKAKKELEERAYNLVIQMKGENNPCRVIAEETGYSKSKVATIWVEHIENTNVEKPTA